MKFDDTRAGNDTEFSWNTIDFPKPRKIQDIEMDWSGSGRKRETTFMTPDASEGFVPKAGKTEESKPEPQPQAQQPQYTAPTQQFGWTMPSSAWTMPAQQQVVVPQPYNVVMPQPLYVTQPVPVVQPVIQPGIQAAYPTMATMPTFQQPAQTTDVYNWLDKELKDNQSSKVDPSQEQFFTFMKKNEDFQKLLDEEYSRYKKKYDTNATSLQLQVQEALRKQSKEIEEEVEKEIKPALDKTAIYTPKAEHAFPQKATNSTLFKSEPVTDFDKMIMEGTQSSEEVGDATLAISNEQLKKEIDEVAQKVEAAYTQPQIKIPFGDTKFDNELVFDETPSKDPASIFNFKQYDENKRQKDLEQMAAAREAFFTPQPKEDLDKTSDVEIKNIFDQWDQEYKESKEKKNKKRKKGGFSRFLLILLLLIAIFVGADFAAITFSPENQIGEFFFGVNDKVEDVYNLVLEKIRGGERGSQGDEQQTLQEATVNSVNSNIQKITFDVDGSKYSEQGTYGFPNLGATAIVDDEQLIADVSKVLVQYNCAWIDHVNSGEDNSCFDFLTADGQAIKAATNYAGVGKVTETFKKLNIGEVRKDADSVYVFADELISVKQGNELTEVPSRVIYRMENVDNDYKIAEYVTYN